MTKPILVANWKNHPGSLAEAQDLLKQLSQKALLYKRLSLFIAPPYPYLEIVSAKARNYAGLASQDISALPKGTYTSAVTTDILKSFGVKLAIIGHSERRNLGETSEQVAEKARAALKAGIVPVVCIGERLRDIDGEYFEQLREQIKTSLAGISKQAITSVILAYEPVWAIGAKEALPGGELSQTVIFIRKILTDMYGRNVAEKVQILYGGSVDQTNAQVLMREGGVRGFLVGRVSLNAKNFEALATSITTK